MADNKKKEVGIILTLLLAAAIFCSCQEHKAVQGKEYTKDVDSHYYGYRECPEDMSTKDFIECAVEKPKEY